MRDNYWLNSNLDKVWNEKFNDIEKKNKVVINWKGKWKNKFGHIRRLKNKDTEITINSLFKDEKVPSWIIEMTIAHEIIHYMHGFHSPHPKLYKHPHKGNIVNKELKKRGYSWHLTKEREWFDKEWLPLFFNIKPKEKGRIIVKHLGNSIRYF